MNTEEIKERYRDKLDMTDKASERGLLLIGDFINSREGCDNFERYERIVYSLISAIIGFQKAHQRECIFPEYTEHGLSHSFTIMGYMHDILNNKSAIRTETYFYLIMAALCHDLGMTILFDDDPKKIASNRYLGDSKKQSLRFDWDKVVSTLDYLKEEDRHKQAIEIIARSLHHEEFVIKNKLNFLLRDKNELTASEIDFIAKICYAHGISVDEIIEISKSFSTKTVGSGSDGTFPLICALLRIGDLLDISKDRIGMFNAERIEDNMFVAANFMVESVNIRNENSNALCISGEKNGNCVRIGRYIQVEFNSNREINRRDKKFIIDSEMEEKAYIYLLEYFDQIESEVKYLSGIPIKDNEYLKQIKPRLIDKINYVLPPKKFIKIGMSDSMTLDLLTSELLYGDCKAAIRELMQNALDACQARKIVHLSDYSPKIALTYDGETFTIFDNGIGMKKSVIESYFLKAGSSLYKSNQYKYSQNQFFHAGHFGLGVFSVFMITDRIEVTTTPATNGRIKTHFIMRNDSNYVQIDNVQQTDINESDFQKGTKIEFAVNEAFKREFNDANALRIYIQKTFLKTAMNEKVTLSLNNDNFTLESLSEKYTNSKDLLRIGAGYHEFKLSDYLTGADGYVCLTEQNSQTRYYCGDDSRPFIPQCNYEDGTPVVVFTARTSKGGTRNRKVRYFVVSQELYEKFGQFEEIIETESVVGLDTFQLMGIEFSILCKQEELDLDDLELYKHRAIYNNCDGTPEGDLPVNHCATEPSTKIFLNDIWIRDANRKLVLPIDIGITVNLLVLNIQSQKITPVVSRNTFDDKTMEIIENSVRYAIYTYLQKQFKIKCDKYINALQLSNNPLIKV